MFFSFIMCYVIVCVCVYNTHPAHKLIVRMNESPIHHTPSIHRPIIAVLALARDAMCGLQTFQHICSHIQPTIIIVLENDSHDNTRCFLNTWALNDNVLHVFTPVLVDTDRNVEMYGSRRIQRMCNLRNQAMERLQQLCPTVDILIWCDPDLDIHLDTVILNQHIMQLYETGCHNDVVVPNIRSLHKTCPLVTLYRDPYAHIENDNNNESLRSRTHRLNYGKFKDNRMKVVSAFGGFTMMKVEDIRLMGIYKPQKHHNNHYECEHTTYQRSYCNVEFVSNWYMYITNEL